MHVAGIREFRSRAPELLGGKELVFVTKHGRLSSIVVPMNDTKTLSSELRRQLLENLGKAISTHLLKTGISEKKAMNDFKSWRAGRRARRRGR